MNNFAVIPAKAGIQKPALEGQGVFGFKEYWIPDKDLGNDE